MIRESGGPGPGVAFQRNRNDVVNNGGGFYGMIMGAPIRRTRQTADKARKRGNFLKEVLRGGNFRFLRQKALQIRLLTSV